MQFYARASQLAKVKRKHARRPSQFPKTFSFIEEPAEAIQALEEFVSRVLTRPGRLWIDQSSCEVVDLCAEAVLNAFAREARHVYAIGFGGHLPSDGRAKEIVRATGVPNELGVTVDETGDFDYYGLHKGRFTGGKSRESSMCDAESTNLVEYLNRCLLRYGYRLTAQAEQRFIDLVAEVINNCEDHSGRHEWWVSAYMRQPKDRPYGDVHIVIFNLGTSIAEKLQTLDSHAALRRQIDDLAHQHQAKRNFATGRYSYDNLWTLCALQGGISSKNVGEDDLGHRGRGTIKMLQAFMHLGDLTQGPERPVMAIVSGATHIRLDKAYPVFQLPNGQDLITLNSECTLEVPPDPNYIRPLGRKFPGTVISLRFYIDSKYLESIPEYAQNHRPG